MTGPTPSNSRQLRLLMVEDNAADAELCRRELKKAGYEVRWELVTNPEDFFKMLTTAAFDLVIADASLPSWSGLEALEFMRRLGRATPFLLLTGTMREEEAAKTLDRGVDDYVLKSAMSRIGTAVRLALERAAMRAENVSLKQRASAGGDAAGFAALNPYAVVELAADGTVLNFNPPAVELAKTVAREHANDLLPPDASVIARTALASGHKRVGVELSMSGRTLSCSFFPIISLFALLEGNTLARAWRSPSRTRPMGRRATGCSVLPGGCDRATRLWRLRCNVHSNALRLPVADA